MRSICVIIVLCLALTGAEAADIHVRGLDNGTKLVVIEGDLNIGDIETFQAKVSSLAAGGATVAFQSRGGRLLAGIRIGTLIRAKKFTTVVPDGAQCASACALAWLGGARRFVGQESNVGFHAAFVVKAAGPAESGPGNAILGAYLNQLGLSEKAILYITRAAPTSMQWMSLNDAAEHGIAVALLPASDSAPAPHAKDAGAAERREGSPEWRAIEFVRALAARWSGPNAEILPALGELYADKVLYYGKPTARQTVVQGKRRFAERWTQRTYTVRPGSLSATCAGDGGSCRVKGVMNWSFRNAGTTQRSRGVTNFEYNVVLKGEALQIAAETSIANRKPRPAPNSLSKVKRNLQQLLAQLTKLRPANPRVRTATRSRAPAAQ